MNAIVQHLEKVINNKIEQGSVFVTDSLRGYQKVAVNNISLETSIFRL